MGQISPPPHFVGLLSPSETSELDFQRGSCGPDRFGRWLQAAGKTHSPGRSRCDKYNWAIFTTVSSDDSCFSDKQKQVQGIVPALSLWLGSCCLTKERAGALRLEVWGELAIPNSPWYHFLFLSELPNSEGI